MVFDYFTANSDEEAATSLEAPEGPAALFPTAAFERIDPYLQVPRAEAFLTGGTEEAAADDPRSAKLLAQADATTVITLTDTFRDALAATDEPRRRELAAFWSASGDLHGILTPDDLLPVVDELAALAKEAKTTGSRMYCEIGR